MAAAKQSPSIRRFRISQRVAGLGNKATNEEAEKARKSQGVESLTELRIIATTPGPVRRSTVIESIHMARNVKADTHAKNAQPSGTRDFIKLMVGSLIYSSSPNPISLPHPQDSPDRT